MISRRYFPSIGLGSFAGHGSRLATRSAPFRLHPYDEPWIRDLTLTDAKQTCENPQMVKFGKVAISPLQRAKRMRTGGRLAVLATAIASAVSVFAQPAAAYEWVHGPGCGLNELKGTAEGKATMPTSNPPFDFTGAKAGAPKPPLPLPNPTPLTNNEILGLQTDADIDAGNQAKAIMTKLAICEPRYGCTDQTHLEKQTKGQARPGKPEIEPNAGKDPAANPGPPNPPGPWIHAWYKQLWVVKSEQDYDAFWNCTRG